MSAAKVQVAVRVRPFNKRERELKSTCVVAMEGQKTKLLRPMGTGGGSGGLKEFVFDHSFWSVDVKDKHFADQNEVFKCLGTGVLDNAFDGYNACIFAYGQTGSGKSYTMMGTEEQKGIIPQLCEKLFATIDENTNETMTYKVEVSYMEIYNEKVRDLLGDVASQRKALKVREHKILGPYVEGLTKLAVQNQSTITRLMDEGNRSRTVASTKMNSESSRSHAVFTILMTQLHYDKLMDHVGEKVSRISLVDLAGSERAGKTGARGSQLREGANINKSLSTLGLVISALAELSKLGKKSTGNFVPYRDSQLTWLLKDNLGGNSKTVMAATISPALDNFEETLSTLRYADRAKRIVNHAKVNEDPNEAMIRDLREEVERLKVELGVTTEITSQVELGALRDKLKESESIMAELNMSWEDKLISAESQLAEREQALADMGISVGGAGIAVDMSKSYLINLNADPMLNEMLVYYLKDTRTTIGNKDAATPQDIVLLGLGIAKEHAYFDMEGEDMFITPLPPAETFVNGRPITEKTRLAHGHRLAVGTNHLFRVNTTRRDDAALLDGQADGADGHAAPHKASWIEARQELDTKASADWEAEKKSALEEQSQAFEAKLEEMKRNGVLLNEQALEAARLEAEEENRKIQAERQEVRDEVARVSRLVREANDICDALGNGFKFQVQMQLSVAALTGINTSAPESRDMAISMEDRSAGETRARSFDSFLSELAHFREVYELLNEGETPRAELPRYFAPVGTELIGVAHIFLSKVQHGMTVTAQPAIIGREGNPAGALSVKLIIEPVKNFDIGSGGAGMCPIKLGDMLRLRIHLEEARGIPQMLSTFVNARFTFFQHEEVMLPEKVVGGSKLREIKSSQGGSKHGADVAFDTSREKLFETEVTPNLLEYFASSSLAIQVWGHNVNLASDSQVSKLRSTKSQIMKGKPAASPALSRKAASMLGIEFTPHDERLAAHQQFALRWEPHKRSLGMWASILELNDDGNWQPVGAQVQKEPKLPAGPIMQLRQGFARRISIKVLPDAAAPLPIARISAVRIGDVVQVESTEAQMQSSTFGEHDLEIIKARFADTLNAHCTRLENVLRESMEDTEMSKKEYKKLSSEWQSLVAERDAMLRPEPGSEMPGAIRTKANPAGYEAVDATIYQPITGVDAPDKNVIEQPLNLPIVQQSVDEWTGTVTCEVSWDSAAHNTPSLLRVTENKNLIYMHLQIDCRLSNCDTDITLDKYIVCRVHKRNFTFRESKKGIFGFGAQPAIPRGVGMLYDVITSLPSFDVKEEVTEAVQTESAAQLYETIAESFKNMVQIDRLKQEQAMRTPKLTQPLSFTNGGVARTASMYRARAHTNAGELPATAIEIELVSKLRLAEASKDAESIQNLRGQLDQLTDVKNQLNAQPQREATSEEWVVIESELEDGVNGSSPRVSRVVRTQSSPSKKAASASPTMDFESPPDSPDPEDPEAGSASLVALFRQKLSSAMDVGQLRDALQYIKVAQREGSLTAVGLESLRQLSKTRSAWFKSNHPEADVPISPDSTFSPIPSEDLPGFSSERSFQASSETALTKAVAPATVKPTPLGMDSANSISLHQIQVMKGQTLGLAVDEYPYGLVIVTVTPGKAAAKSGVKVGTKIVSVQGVDTVSMARDDALELIRKAEGSLFLGTLPAPQWIPGPPRLARSKSPASPVPALKVEPLPVHDASLPFVTATPGAEVWKLAAQTTPTAVTPTVEPLVDADARAKEAVQFAENKAADDVKVAEEPAAAEKAAVEAKEAEEAAEAKEAEEAAAAEAAEAAEAAATAARAAAEAAAAAEKAAAEAKEIEEVAEVEVAEAAAIAARATAEAAAAAEAKQAEEAAAAEKATADAKAAEAAATAARAAAEKVAADAKAAAVVAEAKAAEQAAADAEASRVSKEKTAAEAVAAAKLEEAAAAEAEAAAATAAIDCGYMDVGTAPEPDSEVSRIPSPDGSTRVKSIERKQPGKAPPGGKASLQKSPRLAAKSAAGKRSLPSTPVTKLGVMTEKARKKSSSSSQAFAIEIGDYVIAGNNAGAGWLRYHGEVDFAKGMWCGVELEKAKGKNDGSIEGVTYFSCKENFGIFLKPSSVKKLRPGGWAGKK